MLDDLVKMYGVQDRCIGIEPIDGAKVELMADQHRAAESATAAKKCRAQIVNIGGAALSGLASAIGPLPEMLLVDCPQARIAQVVALTAYHRMTAIPSRSLTL